MYHQVPNETMEPNGPAFSRRCWEEQRETIIRLYQAEDCDFKTLVEIMKSNGFSATYALLLFFFFFLTTLSSTSTFASSPLVCP